MKSLNKETKPNQCLHVYTFIYKSYIHTQHTYLTNPST